MEESPHPRDFRLAVHYLSKMDQDCELCQEIKSGHVGGTDADIQLLDAFIEEHKEY